MRSKIIVLAGLILIILMGSLSPLYAGGNTPSEETVSDNQKGVHCMQGRGTPVEVINLNYVRAEEVTRVLAPLFSEHATIIPYKPSNSLIVKFRQRVCKERD